MSEPSHRKLLGLGALLAIAIYLCLTLMTINRFSSWHDESYSSTLIDNGYANIIERTSWDVHPPFYYLVLKTWSLIFGHSVVGLRLLSTLCMLGAILIAWCFFRKVFGQRAGLMALFGMSVGAFAIRYGQEMRMYGLGALLAASSTLLLWNLLYETMSRQRRRWSLIAYALIMTAAVYTHYFLVFLLAAHALFALKHLAFNKPRSWLKLATWRRLPRGLAAAIIAPLILFLPWIPIMLSQFEKVHNAFWIGPLKVEVLTSTVINFFSFMQQWELVHWTALYGVLVLTVCSFLLVRWYRHLPSGKERDGGRLVAFVFFVPLALLVLTSLPPLQPAYQDRYLAFYAPFIYGAFGLALAHWLKSWRSVLRLSVAGVAMASLVVGVVSVSLTGNNQGWRPLPRFTMKHVAAEMVSTTPKAPIVSTWLWTFMDVHATLPNHQVYLFAPDGVGQYGNYSAVHGRTDILLPDLDRFKGPVWVLYQANSKEEFPMPGDWLAIDRIEKGYAVAVLYMAH